MAEITSKSGVTPSTQTEPGTVRSASLPVQPAPTISKAEKALLESLTQRAFALGVAEAKQPGSAKKEREALDQLLSSQKNPSVAKSIADSITKQEQKGRKAWLDANRDASALYRASNGIGTDEDTIFKTLANKNPEQIALIRSAYNDRYNQNLDNDLRGEFHTAAGRTRIESAMKGNAASRVENPSTPPARSAEQDAESLRKAMDRTGTDESAIKATLENRSKEEIASISKAYQTKYKRDLVKDLRSELSGDELFDVMQAVKGKPVTASEVMQRTEERYQRERSGVMNRVVDVFSKEGAVMDRDHGRVRDAYLSLMVGDSRKGVNELNTAGDVFGISADGFRADKEAVASNVANGAAVAAAIGAGAIAGVASGGLLVPAIAAGAAGYIARAGTGRLIKGDSYGVNETLVDAGGGVVDGLSLGIGTLAGNAARVAIGKVVSNSVAKNVASHVVSGIADGASGGSITGAVNSAAQYDWREGGVDNGIRTVLSNTVISGGIGTVVGAVTGGGNSSSKSAVRGSQVEARSFGSQAKVSDAPVPVQVAGAMGIAPRADYAPARMNGETVQVPAGGPNRMMRDAIKAGEPIRVSSEKRNFLVYGVSSNDPSNRALAEGLAGVPRNTDRALPEIVVVSGLSPKNAPNGGKMALSKAGEPGSVYNLKDVLFVDRDIIDSPSELQAQLRKIYREAPAQDAQRPVSVRFVKPAIAEPRFPGREMGEMSDDVRGHSADRTMLVQRRLSNTGVLGDATPDAPHGHFNGYAVVGREMNVNGGVYLSGHAGARPAIVVDPVRDRTLAKAYSDLRSELPNGMSEKGVVEKVHEFVTKRMRYWDDFDHGGVSVDQKVMQNVRNRGVVAGPDKPLLLGEYIAEGGGQCAHQALFVASLLESLKKDGVIDGSISFERNKVMGSAHAWARYTGKNGEILISDPAQHYVGPMNSPSANWLYLRQYELAQSTA